jgi:hypothetical protein
MYLNEFIKNIFSVYSIVNKSTLFFNYSKLHFFSLLLKNKSNVVLYENININMLKKIA